jgi:hypothetical protein
MTASAPRALTSLPKHETLSTPLGFGYATGVQLRQHQHACRSPPRRGRAGHYGCFNAIVCRCPAAAGFGQGHRLPVEEGAVSRQHGGGGKRPRFGEHCLAEADISRSSNVKVTHLQSGSDATMGYDTGYYTSDIKPMANLPKGTLGHGSYLTLYRKEGATWQITYVHIAADPIKVNK